MNDTGNNREERALDALIAAALLPEQKSEKLPADQLAALAAAKHTTLPEDLAALKAAGNPFAKSRTRPQAKDCVAPAARETAMAMNRKNEKDLLSDRTRAELKKKTRELLG